MCSRTLLAICLGPIGNFQGSYHFLNLVSGLVIKHRAFVVGGKGCSDILMRSTLTKGKRVGVYSDPNLQVI
jgi:hypothetical protein